LDADCAPRAQTFPKHGYCLGMMRCESLRGLESCGRAHLIVVPSVRSYISNGCRRLFSYLNNWSAFVRVGYRRSIRCRRDSWRRAIWCLWL